MTDTTTPGTIAAAKDRLAALAFDVITATEGNSDGAICAVPSTAIAYRNPHYPYERGWAEAAEMSRKMGDAIRKDIYTVLTDHAHLTAALAEAERQRDELRAVTQQLRSLKVDELSPMDCMTKLYELKRKIT